MSLDHLPEPEPDFERFLRVLHHDRPDRVPLVELMISDEILEAVSGAKLPPLPADPTPDSLREWAAPRVRLWHRLGYDYYRVRAEIPLVLDLQTAAGTTGSAAAQREWMNEGSGPIASRADYEGYRWPDKDQIGFDQADAALDCLLPGMKGIGFSGGILEWSSELLGLQQFALMLYDDPDLVRDVVDRVGELVLAAFEVFCGMDAIAAIWLGDDMGFKTSTLISPDHLRTLILPWHRRCAELAHEHGRPFMLHSCGQIEVVMPDLVETVGIDARHSFEDGIEPVESFYRRWSHAMGILGGLDMDLLSRGSADQVRRRTREILDVCGPGGAYACGSGNSVADYVHPENYLAMIETVHQYNGRM